MSIRRLGAITVRLLNVSVDILTIGWILLAFKADVHFSCLEWSAIPGNVPLMAVEIITLCRILWPRRR